MEQNIQIEGIATFSPKGFSFNTGLPIDAPLLPAPRCMRGTLRIGRNGCATMVDNRRIYLPPEVHTVARGVDYHVKRTSRNYIVQMKVPVVESRQLSEAKLRELLAQALGEITMDRWEMLGPALA